MINEKTYSVLSKSDFEKISKIIYTQSGIKIPVSKKIMVEARLRKRLRELNLNDYGDYCNYLFSKEGTENELIHMVDVITTNKTDFFREPKQFDFLTSSALPELADKYGKGIKHPLNIWSAGCSSGEEPYTISMVVNEFSKSFPFYDYKILATDISLKALGKGIKGIYEAPRINTVPNEYKIKYFMRGKERIKKLVRVIPEIRATVNFRWLNFMDEDFGIKEKFDVIFCRNVIIYFDKQTQDSLIKRFFDYLNTDGYLFLGHSESIFNSNLPIKQLAASTYKKLYEK